MQKSLRRDNRKTAGRKAAEMTTEIAVIGGGLGGVASALAALKMGRRVVLSEGTDWIGGQLTAQATPPDEHRWIEQFGCTRSYRALRNEIRDWYRRNGRLSPAAGEVLHLNPGNGYVSRLCCEPRVTLAVLQNWLLPFIASGALRVLLRHTPIAAATEGDRVQSVLLRDEESGDKVLLVADYFLDATELGDLLLLAGIEHIIGAESRARTGEEHAPENDQPLNQQSFSHCFAVSHHPGEDHTVEKPRDYQFWRDFQPDFWPDRLLSWTHPHPITGEASRRNLFDVAGERGGLWRYRRIRDRANFQSSENDADISLVNWPQIDYWLGPLCGVDEDTARRHREGARQLSLSFLYWLQTAAPRPDGGAGFPELKPRGDVTGTRDGLAQAIYGRESRRIQALYTVVEADVSATRPDGAAKYFDSVGIGCYRIDLHPSCGASGDGSDANSYIDIGSHPFQIPLGALLPIRVENVLPACKNIGTTHITNGCYRLHPVEWNIGEAAGILAAHCLQNDLKPAQVRDTKSLCEEFQSLLTKQGIELDWPRLESV